MIVKCGNWDLDTEKKTMYGHIYFVARHSFNPTKVELVFLRAEGYQGKKELVEFIEKRG